MSLLRTAIVQLILALMMFPAAPAIPIPSLDLGRLTAGSDAITVGRISAVIAEGKSVISYNGQSVPAVRMNARLAIVRLVAGRIDAPEFSFNFDVPNLDLGYAYISAGQLGMFFLKGE
jgi:hypothetical protein